MASEQCPLTPLDEFQRQASILRAVKTIAVVGMSPNPDRPSHEVGLFLRDRGYRVIPVHPAAAEIGGLKVARTLTEAAQMAGGIDLADLFVSGDRLVAIVEEAHRLGIPRIWFQPGAEHAGAEQQARAYGMEVVTRACTMAVLKRLG
ncbi:MAG: Succinyl-CoA synthetase [Candidatus Ozemobacter sibiricus]|jgi:predicted CoA-binding protein|uniref:Succinyl-CoA synthetase n=1 Tax=Candidatus Ozemobacter sibiricus TaxID=2268124 RepID=A0A367ZSL7_9BACT|nr:MAG: Succinyl-CoA synthetase [Candidatus Ozemobacter sibiricus]